LTAHTPSGRTVPRLGKDRTKEKNQSHPLSWSPLQIIFSWHSSYGYTGTLNDNTILHLSPFMDRLLHGTFHELEAEAAVVPFMIKEEQFNKVFVLVDGIYPS
jgi:hypothetical protein